MEVGDDAELPPSKPTPKKHVLPILDLGFDIGVDIFQNRRHMRRSNRYRIEPNRLDLFLVIVPLEQSRKRLDLDRHVLDMVVGPVSKLTPLAHAAGKHLVGRSSSREVFDDHDGVVAACGDEDRVLFAGLGTRGRAGPDGGDFAGVRDALDRFLEF